MAQFSKKRAIGVYPVIESGQFLATRMMAIVPRFYKKIADFWGLVGFIVIKMATKIMVDLDKFDPQALASLIKELHEKGFYSNGSIICEEEQRKEVVAIIDKHILNKP